MNAASTTLDDFGGETADDQDEATASSSTTDDPGEATETEDAVTEETSSETREPLTADEIEAYTYEATLYAPLFYSSKEGTVIETDPVISATALLHAIGYEYYELPRAFALAGEQANTPDYSRLCELPFFVSEMVPTEEHVVNERTFRTVSYTTERAVVSQDKDACAYLTGGRSGSPQPRSFEGSRAGWHKIRNYTGITPGTEFRFTIWAQPDDAPPDQLGFRAGIKRTGEVRATRIESDADTVTLNQYLLQSVYDLPDDVIYGVMDNAEDFERGNDVRTARFVNVDTAWATANVMPSVIGKQPEPTA